MNFPRASILSAAAGPLVLPVTVLATAVLTGMATALVGTVAGERPFITSPFSVLSSSECSWRSHDASRCVLSF